MWVVAVLAVSGGSGRPSGWYFHAGSEEIAHSLSSFCLLVVSVKVELTGGFNAQSPFKAQGGCKML